MINIIKKQPIKDILCKTAFIIVSLIIINNIKTGETTLFGYKPLYIMSESMEPTIMTNQIVIGKITDAKDVKKNDIVCYKTEEKRIIHRIIDINDDGTFEFKGDNNINQNSNDKNVKPEQIKYKIIWY